MVHHWRKRKRHGTVFYASLILLQNAIRLITNYKVIMNTLAITTANMFYILQRTIMQLKKLWDNIKTEYKKQISKQKQAAMKTGGGVLESTFTSDAEMESGMDSLDVELRFAFDSNSLCLSQGYSVNLESSAENASQDKEIHNSSLPDVNDIDNIDDEEVVI